MFRRFRLHKAIGDKGLLLILPKPPLCPRLLLGTFVGNVNKQGFLHKPLSFSWLHTRGDEGRCGLPSLPLILAPAEPLAGRRGAIALASAHTCVRRELMLAGKANTPLFFH